MFWATYTGGDLRLAPPPLALPGAAEHQAVTEQIAALTPAAFAALLAAQAVLEWRSGTDPTGPLQWSPPHAEAPLQLPEVRCRIPAGLRQHRTGWEEDIALSAALAAAEEDLGDYSFEHWLWRFLDRNYGILHTEDNEQWQHAVWALHQALTHPHTDPATRRHPHLARALGHSTATGHGRPEPWQLLRSPHRDQPGPPAGAPAAP